MSLIWVAGGRDYDDKLTMEGVLRPYALPGNILITGAAPGADLLAERIWRDKHQLPYIGLPAQWNRSGTRAGFIRNEKIANGDIFDQPDHALFLPGGTGTANAKDRAAFHQIAWTSFL